MIRQADYTDIPRILELVVAAKKIMRSSGNMLQWEDGYPGEDALRKDIDRGCGYIVERPEFPSAVGYFAFIPSPEPTYAQIKGEWTDIDSPYYVIHRIASIPECHGIFSEIMSFAFDHCDNVRIDTHRDNKIMQHLITKAGFDYCGIIYLASGDERLAYQRVTARV